MREERDAEIFAESKFLPTCSIQEPMSLLLLKISMVSMIPTRVSNSLMSCSMVISGDKDGNYKILLSA